jgi:hypothetical protein
MDQRLRELRSSPDEGAVRGGERQARAALRLVSRDPVIRRLILIEVLATTALWVSFFLLRRETGAIDRDADRIFEQWLYWAVAAGIAAVSSVAFASAVDAKIDGVEGDLRMAFGEVRRRLPAVLSWWLISMGAGLALSYAAGTVMRPALALLVLSVVWAVGTLFVAPAIALQDGGPLAPFGEALRFLRARWGRALAGLFLIGFLFGLAFIAALLVFQVTAESHPRTTGEPLWRFGLPLLLIYLVYVVMSATQGAFGVILARDALGDLPGEPPAVKPRRRAIIVVRRVVLGALALAIGLIVVGMLFFRHGSNSRSTTTQTHVPPTPQTHAVTYSAANFATPIREPQARRLHPGAPVVLEGRLIGRVSMVHIERPPLVEVFFEFDPQREYTVIRSLKKVAIRDGRAYLVIVPL